ncbi:class I SAM-dependent methyltransferase [Idiomarina sp. HP20-50]|uniref:class I SAM-dependent methyltransferase n=1 Tax=Idiomarina sp. HP20-50 TaxID=3070813 RepID=UPI00294A9C5E|nr:methyltransferase domain-containing protein [Idiomarina sp. HP20-50]MDV6317117.1 methyltransferase domain-containing protein [Idiomarina sp. HP20-50]
MLIKPAYSKIDLAVPGNWKQLACGQYIKEQTAGLIRRHQRRLKPGKTVALGSLSPELDKSCNSGAGWLTISAGHQAAVRSKLIDLALKENSVDNLIAPFVLEFCRHPHQLLREVTRVLDDDGVLVLTGFNPFSPAAASGFFLRHKKDFPWCGRYFTQVRVKDWLELLGFEVLESEFYVSHFLHHSEHKGVDWSTKLSERMPGLRAAYFIVARKQTLVNRSKPSVQRKLFEVNGRQTATAMTTKQFSKSDVNLRGKL